MLPFILDLDAGVLPSRPFCSRRKCSSFPFGRKLQLNLEPLKSRQVKALLVPGTGSYSIDWAVAVTNFVCSISHVLTYTSFWISH